MIFYGYQPTICGGYCSPYGLDIRMINEGVINDSRTYALFCKLLACIDHAV